MKSRRAQRLYPRIESTAEKFIRKRPGWRDEMNAAIYDCPEEWAYLLPPGTRRIRRAEELEEGVWPLLALTRAACRVLAEWGGRAPLCRVLLAPGDCPWVLPRVRAETVVSWGLSPRDSLTLSSLTRPMLCVQRALPRPDGKTVEPQEMPLPPLPAPAEVLLPFLGLRLLRMPLTEGCLP